MWLPLACSVWWDRRGRPHISRTPHSWVVMRPFSFHDMTHEDWPKMGRPLCVLIFIIHKEEQLFFTGLVLIDASDYIVFWHSGSPGGVCWWKLPTEFVGGGCAGNGGSVGPSQAAKTMCSSLQHEPWQCCVGPLVESWNYLRKKKPGEFNFLLHVFCVQFIFESKDRVHIFAFRTHCAICKICF